MADDADRAAEREEEMRNDELARMARAADEQAAHPSAKLCCICDEPIPQRRRDTVPGVQTCVECQSDLEHALKGGRRK
jgi:phage/conjugal plasmid C-4 type zinc finger TraR family protein